jgi:DNA mismatch endonuclease (patch repair protein)
MYKRDKRSPIPKNEGVSKVMSGNRAKNTKPEIQLRRELWKVGLKGYRLHLKDLPGRPDIAYPSKKFAIFVNGCYWHRCPICDLPLPKNNSDFWEKKFTANSNRDAAKEASLIELGWQVKVIWECQLKKDMNNIVNEIKNILQAQNG